ncbi:ABC transporter ATP-binding protein [Allosediminivita pacifica]|uniref:Peptide/nickel transport system ATP-binding protein n=1 Tax=Allosediminivita pacifica TaxID=1267769 RepID=A0A2T6AS92_9RHOB|nr:ABC transporter ATP-binding protein [Allosediminivita pacifica]PTX46685.1 peptide/nickel transport system ATP-binding protein [Allosediminivita pacifica]GGB16046.1 ABC transporter ATP-binding protein [Allosediminivita pacifica]
MTRDPALSVDGLSVDYPLSSGGLFRRARSVTAVSDVSLQIAPGETLGLVGESGSGKTTVGRAILRRVPASAGRISFEGKDITHLRGDALRKLRARMQLILQDPYTSLNPRMTVADIVAEPLLVHGLVASRAEAAREVRGLLDRVGMPADAADRYPHSFSGGQRQRIGIARALALKPSLIVADEPVSALDVSVRAQVVNLMQDLQRELGIAFLFIAHDLAIVRHISHRVAIMYAGRIVEVAPREAIYERPVHPYTEALLSAVPVADPPVQRARRRIIHPGEAVDIADPPSGCRFHPRCPIATERCRDEVPPLEPKAEGHMAACWNRGGVMGLRMKVHS